MILVTVGTKRYPFNRLMHWIDALFNHGFLQQGQEEIVVQYGSCTVLPSGVRIYPLLPEDQFHSLIQQARLIIAHCGEGTITLLERTSTPFILVPRSHRFGEHGDEHQIELAVALAEIGVPIAWSPGDLVRFIESPRRTKLSAVPEHSIAELCHNLETKLGQRDTLKSLEALPT
jgi:UDP-N-acetylglucosamine transferase subunit ALG13